MEKITISFENCYGINKLDCEFDLSHKSFSIYAPNGAMKTSFAKTFTDISNEKESSDLMFPERITVREVKDENNTNVEADNIFVVAPYNNSFRSTKMSTLLVNKDLRQKYDDIHLKINEKKEILLKLLVKKSGVKKDIEDQISEDITFEKDKFYTALERIEKEVFDKEEPAFSNISYKTILNDKVLGFLNTADFKKEISEYINKYNDLIDSSTYFKKGFFNHNNASVIAKSLADNGFFKAKHSVSLNAAGGNKEISQQKELEEIIDEEKNEILNDPDLIKSFNKIDTKLKANKELRDFREYLITNMNILPELDNIGSFKQKLWISYIKESIDEFKDLIDIYQSGKKELEEIVEQANKEKTSWISVIEIFNKRFSVPFYLEVDNQSDVILKDDIPSIKFVFKDSKGQATVNKEDLLNALSNGEKRALYILNIIFEVEARKRTRQETIFIIDDIAESFDYKNKYAIIEYLKDISSEDIFWQIILTHNFDFFRTIESRFVRRNNSFMIVKNDEKIELIGAGYLKPFKYFKDNMHNNKCIMIASIPFARNLIEYTKDTDDDDYIKLTSLLHIKDDTHEITVKDLEVIFNDVFNKNITYEEPEKTVIDLIFELTEEIAENAEIKINLENKIILSIAIRLKAEQFMKENIANKELIDGIESNQTFELFDIYRNEENPDLDKIKTIEQVNLMTPENIHFNSFMYEPILDMSDEHLKNLYNEFL